MLKTSGLVSPEEAAALARSLAAVVGRFPGERLVIAEVGTWDGVTSRGIRDYLKVLGADCNHWVLDAGFRTTEPPYPDCLHVLGDSMETFYRLPDKIHWALIDGCHCVNHTLTDLAHIGSRVVPGGELCVHDTDPKVDRRRDYQGHGPDRPEFYIGGVRLALKLSGMLPPLARDDWVMMESVVYPVYDGRTGVTVYRKVRDLAG